MRRHIRDNGTIAAICPLQQILTEQAGAQAQRQIPLDTAR